jgi:uncharacterized protein (TIGR03000 family)
MLRRCFPAVGALALLLGSAGTSSAQAIFLPIGFGNPVFGSGPWAGGGFGYPGGFYTGGMWGGYGPRSYGAFSGYGPTTTGVSTYATNPYYNGYNAALGAQANFLNPGAAPNYASYNLFPTSYVAYSGRGTTGTGVTAVAYSTPDLPARVIVHVPASAELWFDGHLTSQTGTERTFHTPALEKGRSYHYDVKARWMKDGKPVEQSQRVEVYADGRATVTFPKP